MRAIFFPLEGILIKTHFFILSGFAAVGMVGVQIKARKSSRVNRPLRVDLSTQNFNNTSPSMRTPCYGTQKTCRKRIDYTVNEQTQSNKLQIYFSSSMEEFLGLRMSQKNIFRAGKDTVGGFFIF